MTGEGCYLYLLIDPRKGMPFYIGISQNPWQRFKAHQHDRTSAAWDFLGFLTQNCGYSRDEILWVGKCYSDRATAAEVEYQAVIAIDGLLNRPYKRGRSYT